MDASYFAIQEKANYNIQIIDDVTSDGELALPGKYVQIRYLICVFVSWTGPSDREEARLPYRVLPPIYEQGLDPWVTAKYPECRCR